MNSAQNGTDTVAGAPEVAKVSPFVAPRTDTTLSESLIVLRNRRGVIISTMVVGILIGLYQSFTQPRMYEAFGRIQVRSGSTNEYKLSSGGMGGFGDEQRKLTTEVAVLTSDTLLISVARDLNLANDTIFLQSKIQGPRRSLDDAGVRMQVLGTLKHNLAVTLVPKTDLIQIKYGSLNAQLSEDIVNKLIEDYVQRTFETRFQSTQRVSRWLSGQLDDLKHQVEVSQNQMLELQKKVGFVAFDATHNEIATSLDDLSKADGTAKLARILAESRYRQLAAMNPDAMGSSLEVGTTVGQTIGVGLPALRSQLATAREQAAQLATSLGPNHPQVKAANAQLQQMQLEVETEEKRLLEQSKQAYLMAKANEDQTRAALDEQKASAYKLQDDMVAYTLQQRNYETNRSLYEELTKRLETAGIQAGLESLEIDVVDRAMLPAYATMTPRSTIISAYTVVGLVIGIMLAFILESLDTGLRSIAEIEGITELPSLAIVPRAKRSTPEQLAAMTTVERNVSVLMQPKSQFTEAFRSLRTALMLSLVGREPKFILFTSATPSEGKTTTASNLAVILSQRGTRVLLIDADLRRPNVHHRFGLNGKLGLSTVLSGQTKLIQSVQQVREVPGLDILASGPVPPFPTEMLSSEAMSDVLREAGEIYTHVIIDSPPVLSVTDGVLLSRQVDAVVLVVRHAKSSKHIVRRGRDLLVRSGAPLVGIVLNAVDLNAPEYYGYYGYTGYSYSSIDPAGWDAQSGSNKSSKKKDKR